MVTELTTAQIWAMLEQVKDPEIPAVSLIEMGIIRDVNVVENCVTVIMTPTFSGCPALAVMEEEIRASILALGAEQCHVQKQFNPPWTSDWISNEGRRKLKEFGLAPPRRHGGQIEIVLFEPAVCPRCQSSDTSLKNDFGTTLCRSIYVCNRCQEPFEQFKAL
ncbi:MAG: 1,2-phenylacetyl-CoA epoxidase subunit PaaD [Chloroflexota bacterium]